MRDTAGPVVLCEGSSITGPVTLAAHETSFAQTVVLGDDPRRHRLVEDLRGLFTDGREAFRSRENITGGQLHAQVLAPKAAWELTTWHVGRLTGPAVGDSGDTTREEELIAPHNSKPRRRRDQAGFPAHWVMEIQLVDEHRGFGGTLKQLLDLVWPPGASPDVTPADGGVSARCAHSRHRVNRS
ncbi:hypothetical protein AB0F16_00005 [Streptomyces tanashiensis]|uniref:hypothetical protein n=1 Tax=Streptomyces tanashiensis TaxID=67367 RepID=UPI0033FF5722